MRIAAVVMNLMRMMNIRITAHGDIVGGAAASSFVKTVADIIRIVGIVVVGIVVDCVIVAAAAIAVVHHEGDAGKALLFGGRVFHFICIALFYTLYILERMIE